MKAYFKSDYTAGALPEIIHTLTITNLEHTAGYGQDPCCTAARQTLLEACGLPDGQVEFVTGGTQTNTLVLDGLLGRCQGVLAAETAHINVHESGAIEATGHKIITLPTTDGKIKAPDIDRYVTTFFKDDTWPHMVEPGAVYLSFPTELGTIYSRQELEDIAATCRRHRLPLYIDGARLGYGLSAPGCDLTLKNIARLADIFYIGGTKQGALFGEAVVSAKADIIPRFTSLIKQHGALLAKGRLLGLQFQTLFSDDLYFRASRRAIDFAMQIQCLMQEAGYPLFIASPTNQQFFVLPNDDLDRLQENIAFELWGPRGADSTPVRFVTSWATTADDIRELTLALERLKRP